MVPDFDCVATHPRLRFGLEAWLQIQSLTVEDYHSYRMINWWF